MNLHVKLVLTLPELDALQAPWRSLSASVPDNIGAFCSWDFVHTYLSFFQSVNWLVAAVFADSEHTTPVAIFPLVLFNAKLDERTWRMCEPLGLRYCAYTEFPMQPEYRAAAIDAVLAILRERYLRDSFIVGQLHETSRTYLHLLESSPPLNIKTLRKPAFAYIDARLSNFETFMASKRKAVFADVLRRERRLAERGPVDFHIAADASNLSGPIRELCGLGTERFGSAHLFSGNGRWIDYVVELANRLIPRGEAEFSCVRCDGRIIASHLCLLHKGRRFSYLIGHDPEYEKYSPSKLLLLKLIEKTFQERGVFCFGPGLYPYKVEMALAVAEVRIPWIFFRDEARAALDDYVKFERLSMFYVD